MKEGAYTALVTPFRNGEIDEQALRSLIDFQIDQGISGLVACGTTGEGATLSNSEFDRVTRIVVEQTDKRVFVFTNAGTNATNASIERAKASERAGVDGLLLVCPYYNKPSQAGLNAHFKSIAEQSKLPIMLYNVPSRTSVGLQLETILELAQIPTIAAIKEASGNVVLTQQIFSRLGNRMKIFAGDDALSPSIIALGGAGIVSVTSNIFPKLVSRIAELCLNGNFKEGVKRHLELLPFHQSLFKETNPGPIKAAMHLLEKIEPEIRLPLTWPSESTIECIRQSLKQAEAISCA